MITNELRDIVHSDPEIVGGTPVFVGTRVPVDAMFDYLVAGDILNRFLRHFPTVSREQAIEALEVARKALLDAVHAHSAMTLLIDHRGTRVNA